MDEQATANPAGDMFRDILSEQEHRAFSTCAGLRGGRDTVDVLVRMQEGVEHLGTISVAGLLDYPTHAGAEAAIEASMRAEYPSSNWAVLQRSVVTGRFQAPPPSGWFWPTNGFYKTQVESGLDRITAVLDRAPVLWPSVEQACVSTPDGGLLDRADVGGAGAPQAGEGNNKRQRLDSSSASSCAVLFASSARGSLMELEASLLVRFGLVCCVVFPTNLGDIVECLDKRRPNVVVLSASHCGACYAACATCAADKARS